MNQQNKPESLRDLMERLLESISLKYVICDTSDCDRDACVLARKTRTALDALVQSTDEHDAAIQAATVEACAKACDDVPLNRQGWAPVERFQQTILALATHPNLLERVKAEETKACAEVCGSLATEYRGQIADVLTRAQQLILRRLESLRSGGKRCDSQT